MLLRLLQAVSFIHLVRATSVQLLPQSCQQGNSAPSDQVLTFSSFYAQYDTGQTQAGQLGSETTPVLRIVGLATVDSQSTGYSPDTGFLATVVATSNVLSYDVYSNNSALCDSIRSSTGASCPYGPGEVAFGLQFPLKSEYPLSTIRNRIRILDTSNPSQQLACYDLAATPLYPEFWAYDLFLWFTVGLVIAYAVITWIGRAWAAQSVAFFNREAELASSLTAMIGSRSFRKVVGPIFWEAASGATLQTSAALRRFATPGVREVLWAVQAVALLGLVSVEWPDFIYPITSKTAWSMLTYNITLTQSDSDRVDPLRALTNDQIYPNYATQLADTTSPLYQDDALPNVLLDLSLTRPGIERFARSVGLRPQDLFNISAAIFLCLVAAAIILSIIFLLVDVLSLATNKNNASTEHQPAASNNGYQNGVEDGFDRDSRSDVYYKGAPSVTEQGKVATRWWQNNDTEFSKSRPGVSLVNHACLLIGNVLRLILLFHLPLVIFSTYQITLLSSGASTASVAMAVLVLVIICTIIPALAIFKIWRTPESSLQDKYSTLLALGPMYNVFGERSYCFMMVRILGNLCVGIVIGAGQGSGTAQAVVILIVEIVDTLVTSLWLPWGDGAAMGPLAFLFSVGRIVTAVLLIVLSPAVSVDPSVGGWIAYVAVGIQAFLLIFLFFLLLVKLLELIGRAAGKVPFDESRSSRATGLGGALRKWDRDGQKKRGKRQRRTRSSLEGLSREGSHQRHSIYANERSESVNTRTMMLPAERPDSRHTRHLSASSYGDYYAGSRGHHSGDEYDDGFIMSAMSSGPWLMTQHQHQQQQGYVQPGSYSAMQQPISAHDVEDLATPSEQPRGFAVVRGGRATDDSPYTMSSVPGAHGLKRPSQSDIGEDYYRSSSDYFAVHNPQSIPARPEPPVFLSNSTNQHLSAPSSPVPEASSRKTKNGFFGRFGRKTRRNSFDSSDDEDEEQQKGSRHALWPFTRRKEGRANDEPLEELEEVEQEAPPQQSFKVIRKPRNSAGLEAAPVIDS